MSPRVLYRFAAVALVVTGVSLTLGMILHPSPPYAGEIATSGWAAAHVFWWIGGLGAMPGLTGAYLFQREDVGRLGFVGSGLAVLGSALIACAMYFEAFVAPSAAALAPELFRSYPAGGGWEGFLAGVLASGLLVGVGFLVFGFVMLRADILPRWAILVTMFSALPFGLNFLLPRALAVLVAAAFGVGLAGLGHGLWKGVARSGDDRYVAAESVSDEDPRADAPPTPGRSARRGQLP